MTTLFIVDDNAQMRDAYALLVEDEPGLTLSGTAATVAEALTALEQLTPDALIVDVSLPDGNGIDLVRRLKAWHRDAAVIVVSGHDEIIYAEEALAAGARGYLTKDHVVSHLAEAVHRVLNGEEYLSPNVAARLRR